MSTDGTCGQARSKREHDLTSFRERVACHVRKHWLLLLLALGGVIYVANAWTPSSYAYFLNSIGVQGQGPVLGKARSIRGDEFAVSTPYFQIAVKNHFQRINQFSPYHEDLRSFLALPLRDWALVFRPQMWAFYLLDPAYAYSFYYYFFLFSFLFGFYQLFLALRIDSNLALLGALLLFFSRFTQVWWSSNAPGLSLVPWVGVVYLSAYQWPSKLLAFFLVWGLCIFGGIYPPFFISAIFATAILILALRPDAVRLSTTLAGIIALGLIAWLGAVYYRDAIALIQTTVYPGQRISSGGGEPPMKMLSHLLPYVSAVRFKSLIGLNECEIASLGSFLPLLTLFFVDYKALRAYGHEHRKTVIILLSGLAAMLAWMCLPIPAEVGRFLLWDRVPANRMIWGFGLLLTIGLIALANHLPWYFNAKRAGGFALVVLAAWIGFKFKGDLHNLRASWFDAVVLVFLAPAVAVHYKFPSLFPAHGERPKLMLCGIAVATGMATFGLFNPLQSAKPIFHTPETPMLARLKADAARNPHGWVVTENTNGACLNGLGMHALPHVLMLPRLDFFRPFFPDMPAEQFNTVFNRYAHIVVTAEVEKPESPRADVVLLPLERFAPPFRTRILSARPDKEQGAELPSGIDNWKVQRLDNGGCRIVLRGWTTLPKIQADPVLGVFSDRVRIQTSWATRLTRDDIAASLKGPGYTEIGFVLILRTEREEPRSTDRDLINSIAILSGNHETGAVISP